MPASDGPLLPRRRLGKELRQARGQRTLDEVAQATMMSTSRLSRLENGQGAPQLRDIRDLINYYQVDRATAERFRRWANEGRKQAWWKEYSEVIGGPFDAYLDFESGASVIRYYAPLILPGLLQTRDYATEIVRTLPPPMSDEQAKKLVELRMRRQDLLLNTREEPTHLLVLLDEAALHRVVGSRDQMLDQLAHLRELSKRGNISIRIVPFGKGAHPGLLGMFTVFQFADDIDLDIASLETYSGDRYMEEQSSVLEYLRTFDTLTRYSLEHEESRQLLTNLMETLTRVKDEP